MNKRETEREKESEIERERESEREKERERVRERERERENKDTREEGWQGVNKNSLSVDRMDLFGFSKKIYH